MILQEKEKIIFTPIVGKINKITTHTDPHSFVHILYHVYHC